MKRHKPCRGANLVEATLTTLLFFSVMFAIFDVGRALNVYHALTDAAREGARYSVAPFQGTAVLPSSTDVQTFTQAYLTAANISGTSGATVSVAQGVPEVVNGSALTYSQVTVTIAAYSFVFLPVPPIALTATARMRNETN